MRIFFHSTTGHAKSSGEKTVSIRIDFLFQLFSTFVSVYLYVVQKSPKQHGIAVPFEFQRDNQVW